MFKPIRVLAVRDQFRIFTFVISNCTFSLQAAPVSRETGN